MDVVECNGINNFEEQSPITKKSDKEGDTIFKNYFFQSVDNAMDLSLHCSVKCGDIKMTQYLLDNNYCINAQDFDGITTLMIAVKNRQDVMIKILLEAGADITILNNDDISALHIFCADHYFTNEIQKIVFQKLRKKFSTSEETAQCFINAGGHLYQAAYMDDSKVLEYMLEQGFAVDLFNPVTRQTALHVAVLMESVDSVKLLLKYAGSNTNNLRCENNIMTQYLLGRNYYVNTQDSTGTTALMISVENSVKKGNDAITQILLDAGADITMLNYEGMSALHMFCAEHSCSIKMRKLFFRELRKKFSTSEETAQCFINAGGHLYQAAYMDDSKVLEYMLEQGFAVDSIHPWSTHTALHSAVMAENSENVKVLIKYGINVNALGIKNYTPLYYIYFLNSEHTSVKIEMLQTFLNLGASLTSCNSLGYFQIGPTLAKGNREAIRAVLQANLNFTAKDQDTGRTILHYFAFNRNAGICQELKPYLDKCDLNVVDEADISPLHIAVSYKNVPMVEFLLSQGAAPNNCGCNKYSHTPLYIAYAHFQPLFENEWDQCLELLLQYSANPQFIIRKKSRKRITIFDAAEKTNCIDKLKPVIAHLAVLKELGVSITKTTSHKINSYLIIKKYFQKCQKMLKMKISGSVSLFKLLTDDEKKMARYARNGKLMLNLTRLSYKQDFKFSYLYFRNTLRKRLSRGIQYGRFLDEISSVICKIFENRIDKKNLIIYKIIDYLNNESLSQLYKLSVEDHLDSPFSCYTKMNIN